MGIKAQLEAFGKVLIMVSLLFFTNQSLAKITPEVNRIDAPKSILFVGNSLTRGNDGIYTHLENLLASTEQKTEVAIYNMTKNGATLLELSTPANQLIAAKRWGAVILQEYSDTPIANYDGFIKGIQSMMLDIRMQRAQPVLFMTWAYKDTPEMTTELRDAYVLAGNQYKALVVPVGLAYARAVEALPDTAFYTDDRHATLAGTYLATCVFYSSLFGQPSSGTSYTAGLSVELATSLQRIADETVNEFYTRTK